MTTEAKVNGQCCEQLQLIVYCWWTWQVWIALCMEGSWDMGWSVLVHATVIYRQWKTTDIVGGHMTISMWQLGELGTCPLSFPIPEIFLELDCFWGRFWTKTCYLWQCLLSTSSYCTW